MKKTTLQAIRDYLANNETYADNEEMTFIVNTITELDAELHKGEAAKAKNAEAYEAIHDLIVGNLSDTPVTCGELYDAIESELPEGMTKGKVQYALTHLWQDEIVKVEGKPNGYRKA